MPPSPLNTMLENQEQSPNQKQMGSLFPVYSDKRSAKTLYQQRKVHINTGAEKRHSHPKNDRKADENSDDNIRKENGQQDGANKCSPVNLEREQSNFPSRRLHPTVGGRMRDIRLGKESTGKTLSHLTEALSLGGSKVSDTMYESFENGTSALEEWGSTLMTFALNLEVPINYLIPIISPSLPLSLGYASTSNKNSASKRKIEYKPSKRNVVTTTGAKKCPLPTSPQTIFVDAIGSRPNEDSSAGSSSETTCGSRLKTLRNQRDLSVEELLKDTCITQGDLLIIEQGNPTHDYEKWVNIIGSFSIFYEVSPLMLVIDLRPKPRWKRRNIDNTKWKRDCAENFPSDFSSSFSDESNDKVGERYYGERSHNNNSGNNSSSNSSFLIDNASFEPSTIFPGLFGGKDMEP